MARHVVATTAEIAPGTCKIVTVRGREIGVFNLANDFYALINTCPHQGAKLCQGEILSRLESPMPGEYHLAQHAEMIRCPWHCWEFDIRTGQSWCEPNSVHARSFTVQVEPGAALIEGPFAAEKVEVTVEQDYVVITM